MGALREDVSTFVTISRWILLRMRNVSNKSCRENQNTYFMFSNFFPRVVPFMTMWEICAEDIEAVDNMVTARGILISKATRSQAHTPTYVVAFPRQQWFRESALVLRHTYVPSIFTATQRHFIKSIMSKYSAVLPHWRNAQSSKIGIHTHVYCIGHTAKLFTQLPTNQHISESRDIASLIHNPRH
jgi:hypothetical protein